MLPILWRFLLSHYFKGVLLCTTTIVAILLTTRLDDIAHFVALGAPVSLVFWFIVYQIPYILPIAIPISCLIASILIVQSLSKSHELTAMRAAGMAIKEFMLPILTAASLLAVLNFFIVSEVATQSHLLTNVWKKELRSMNPLLLLKNKQLMKTLGLYFDVLGKSQVGESAEEVVIAFPEKKGQRIHLMTIGKMLVKKGSLQNENLSVIASLENKKGEAFDTLYIENVESTEIPATDFSFLFQHKSNDIHHDELKMSLLLARLKERKEILQEAKAQNLPKKEIKEEQKELNQIYSEITRRFSTAFTAISLTLLGLAFGITIQRSTSSSGVIAVIVLSAAYLCSYFAAKSMEDSRLLSLLLYTVPHLAILAISTFVLRRVSRGTSQ